MRGRGRHGVRQRLDLARGVLHREGERPGLAGALQPCHQRRISREAGQLNGKFAVIARREQETVDAGADNLLRPAGAA